MDDYGLFIYSIGKSLVRKAKYDSSVPLSLYNHLKRWVRLDPLHSTVIMIESLNDDSSYDVDKLTQFFDTRIRSSKKLTKIFNSVVNPKI